MSRTTRRERLQATLESILGNRNVYFQPPASISLSYPCIVYSYDGDNERHADDGTYLRHDRYSLTLITKNAFPDEIMKKIDSMPYVRFDRHYEADNLHHFSYNLNLLERNPNG